MRSIYASYSAQLSTRDSVRCRRLIESDWYRTRWPHIRLTSDQNQKTRFDNDLSGCRISTSVGGTATGERADLVVVDDPLSVSQADSDAERESAAEWFFSTLPSRFNDLKTGRLVVIQQRLHESDVVGHILKRDLGYDLLELPMEYSGRPSRPTSIGWTDPRTEPGQLLVPDRIGLEQVEDLKKSLGSRRYSAQYQQTPAPAGGGIWKRDWIKFYRRSDLPQFDRIILSWDLTFKDSDGSDYVSGQAWGAKGSLRYLLDRFHERADFTRSLQAIRKMKADWPRAEAVLVEDAANGPAVVSTLKREISGLIAVKPEGSKLARASSVSPQFEAGQVFVPHQDECRWVDELLLEWTSFPAAAHDDEVDSASQALSYLAKQRTQTRLINAWEM
ncbi:MAG: phage terminase large subunit [Acidobacteria bacterium]|nr:phage terminase large subunit [Acidobacteriota bacterium]